MYLRKLSKSELIVMKFIWNLDTKVKSYQIINYMKENISWSEKTNIKNTLSKLSNKRFIYDSRNKSMYILYNFN